MAMTIKNNIPAKRTLNELDRNAKAMSKDLSKVSSGLKIRNAEDDASGYAISERMDVQITSLDQANQNAQNGGALLKTAEGAMQSTVDALRTLKEKAIDSANDTNTNEDRAIMQKEFDQIIDQVDDNALTTYNGKVLIDGSHNDGITDVATHMTNQNLAEDTTGETSLLDLKNRNGEPLLMQSSDTITVSWVQNGKTSTVTVPMMHETKTYNKDYDDWVDPPEKEYLYGSEPYKISDLIQLAGGEWKYDSKVKSSVLSGSVVELVENSGDASYIGQNGFGVDVHTADNTAGITFKAKTAGIDGQIAGFTISINDSHGIPRKDVNKALEFTTTIFAENASPDNAITLQVGTKANQAVKAGFSDMRAEALGLKTPPPVETLSISSQSDANAAINVLDNALQRVLDQQTKTGSIHNRLEYTSANLTNSSENTQAAKSTIADADMAAQMASYTKNNILLQASQSMLAQANQNSSSVLSLLQ
ncbi:flagellin N-terminal helical domain-containing protein [Selenomonas ruminantium]|uniref:Flagellin n=1 Tax=Selenomonas ruminantium TaxID=971 RepID=A0A1H3ZGI6_SELRU|nr:flagellin [Selenomonas ruminantium]SEA22648.1 flagellin [Selenomonas ruminantium]